MASPAARSHADLDRMAAAEAVAIAPSDQPKWVEAAALDSSSANLSPVDALGDDQGSGAGGGGGGGVAGAKKPAWNRPSPNGVAEMGAVVMGAASWPALSESTKTSPKSSTSDALMPASDGSVSAPAGPADQVYSPKLNSDSNGSHNVSAAKPTRPSRQKSMKRGGSGGNGGGSGNGVGGNSGSLANGVVLPSLQVPAPSQVAPETPKRHGAPQVSPRDHLGRNAGGWEQRPRGGGSGSHGHGGSENHRGHGGNRRGNNGGGGDRHNNYGKRWEPELGVFDGYHHRGFSNRDPHMQQRGPPPLLRPHLQPVLPATYFSRTPTVRAYGNPSILYPEFPSSLYYIATQPHPETFRPVSIIPYPVSPPPLIISPIDPHRAAVLKQIEYYFSPENLCKDTYLREHMDEQGWVHISVVAGFNKVKQLTDSVNYILEAVRFSATVEVQGENIRVRNDWIKWVMPPNGNQYTAGSIQQAPTTPALDGQANGL